MYGRSFIKFNVHQLLHINKAARKMGSLWRHSAFVFESGNGKFLKLATAAKGVTLQIVERVIRARHIDFLLTSRKVSDEIKKLTKKMM